MGDRYRHNDIRSDGHVTELLPDYIDRILADEARGRVRAHLEECAGCRADYVELQATRQLLASVPLVAAPRTFTLTEEMAAGLRRPSLLQRIFAPRLAPGFAGGSVLAFLLVILVLAGANSSRLASEPTAFAPPQSDMMKFAPTSQASESSPQAMQQPTTTGADPGAGGARPEDEETASRLAEPTAGPGDSVPAPAATPAPGASEGEPQPGAEVTSDPDISGSGSTGPTTLPSDVAPNVSQPGLAPGEEGAQPTPAPPTGRFDLASASAAGLLALSALLAAAAIVARRGST